MPTREEIILDLIQKARPAWQKFIFATRPRQRSCRFCGAEYVGLRDICGEPLCLMAWQEWLQEHERRHPRMPSSGMAFYLDYLATRRDP